MMTFFKMMSAWTRVGLLILSAVAMSSLSFVILFLEYGVFNFGDSDLPPYQPDTLFEGVFNVVWFVVTSGAGLLWLCVILYVVVLLSRVSFEPGVDAHGTY
jgi:hypothetical protein